MRRTPIALITLLLPVLAACGGPAASGDAAPATSQPSSPATDGAYPATIATSFGDVTVDEEPQRVVALGWGDAETALVLGVQPVGASDWLGYGDDGVGPWLDGAYEKSPTIIDTTQTSAEAVAALRPDLILDTRSDGTQERYDQLSQIAPVIGAPEGVVAFGTSWQQQLEMVGQALGRSEKADEVEADTEGTFAEVAEANPDLAGKTVTTGAYFNGGYGAYVSGDSRVDLLTAIGLENKPEIDALGDGSFYVDVSKERLNLLDADLTVMFPLGVPASEFTSDPLYQAIPSVADGRDLVIEDETLRSAFSSGTAPGSAYAAERIGPLLNEAVGGSGS